MDRAKVRTKRWTRSPRGPLLGVATGLAEWRGFPPDAVRIIVLIACCCTGFMPGCLIYLALAIFLPEQRDEDIIGSGTYYSDSYSGSSANEKGKSTEDLRREYEEMKRKVEEMEAEMFDREKDWDERFRNAT